MTDISRRDWHKLALGALAGAAAPGTSTAEAQARGYRYIHLDVFTDRALTGNQLAVFTDPAGLSTESMSAMTREMNYSECTFLGPGDPTSDFRVRIFGRGGNEMQFAGHPVIGTTFALAHIGRVKSDRRRIVLALGLGPTPIDLEWKGDRLSFAWMAQQLPKYGPTIADVDGVAAALGVEAGAIRSMGLPIQEVWCGSAFYFVAMATRQAVDAAALNRPAIDAVFQNAQVERRGVFVFSPEKSDDGADAYSRMLGAGGFEDPATGSASGPLGCYMVRHKVVPRERAGRILSRQGVKMGRPSRIHIDIGLKGDAIAHVKVGGESVVVGEGTLAAG